MNRPELEALFEAASDEPTNRNLYGVLFVVEGDKVYALAANGVTGLCGTAVHDAKHHAGSWMVSRDLLTKGKNLLEGKQMLRLEFHGNSLRDVQVEENDKERSRLQWPVDAVQLQTTFPDYARDILLPSSSRKVAHCHSLGVSTLTLVQKAAKAAEVDFVDWYAPKNGDDSIIFVAGDSGPTTWKGIIRPLQTAEAEDEDKPEKRKRGRTSAEAQPEAH